MSGMGPAMGEVATVQGVAASPAPAIAQQPVAGDAGAQPAVDMPIVTTDSAAAAPVAAVVEAQPATTAAAATPAPAKVTFPVQPTAASTQVPAVGHASAAGAGSIGGAVFSLLLVIGLILGLAWLARRMPGMHRGAGTSHLKVVASVALGPRERAVVVDVGGTQLLLGVGNGGVRTLHTLEQPLPVADDAAPSPFAQVLAQHFGRKR